MSIYYEAGDWDHKRETSIVSVFNFKNFLLYNFMYVYSVLWTYSPPAHSFLTLSLSCWRTVPQTVPVTGWMDTIPHELVYLNVQFLVGNTLFGNITGSLGDRTLLEGVCHWGQALRICSPSDFRFMPIPVCTWRYDLSSSSNMPPQLLGTLLLEPKFNNLSHP